MNWRISGCGRSDSRARQLDRTGRESEQRTRREAGRWKEVFEETDQDCYDCSLGEVMLSCISNGRKSIGRWRCGTDKMPDAAEEYNSGGGTLEEQRRSSKLKEPRFGLDELALVPKRKYVVRIWISASAAFSFTWLSGNQAEILYKVGNDLHASTLHPAIRHSMR